jgi:hypothetical protein
MRLTLRSGRALFAAPYQSSNKTMEETANLPPDPIAASIRILTGEFGLLNTAIMAFVSRQIIR